MLPGRELIYEIEKLLFDHHSDEGDISGRLDDYIIESISDQLDNPETLGEEYESIKREYPEGSKERLNAILDMISGEVESEISHIEPRLDTLEKIESELEKLYIYEDDDD